MALGTFGSTLNDELNRLANGGTYRTMATMVDEALAAKQWANRENINPYSTDTVGILNEIAGLGTDKRNWLDFNGVCNYIAGTTGLPAAAALRQVYNTTDLLTSQSAYYVDALYPTGTSSTPGYVYLSGASGNYMSTPDDAALDITGDIDIRVKVAFDNWIPSAQQGIIGKVFTSGQYSYWMTLESNGTLRLAFSNNGTTVNNRYSTVATGLTNGSVKWIRATLDVDNGSSQNEAKFYLSDDGSSWTQLGTTVTTAGTTSIYSGTSLLEIGSISTTGNFATGKFYRAQIFNGIDGTKVFDADMSNVSLTVTSFTESSSNAATVTINGFRAYPQDAANLGSAGSLLPTTLGSSTAADSNDPKFLDFTGTNYVYLPGVIGNFISVPDSNDLDITGDIDIRVNIAADLWATSYGSLLYKYNNAVTTGQSFAFYTLPNGSLGFAWRESGGTLRVADLSTAHNTPNGSPNWVRVTLDVDNGAGQYEVKYFTSPNGSTWTQLGSTITGTTGPTNIVATTTLVSIGSDSAGSGNLLPGKYYRAQIFGSINGTNKVLDVDTSVITAGSQTSFTAVTGQTVTINRSTSGRKTVAVTQPTWLFGTDDYMEVNNRYMAHSGTNYLYFPGIGGNYASVPNISAYNISGDIDVRCQLALDNWTSGTSYHMGKVTAAVSGSWDFGVTNGLLQFEWTTTGSNYNTANSTSAVTFAPGTLKWVRATLTVSTGTVKFYTSDDGTTWTQLGNDVVKGATSVYIGTDSITIGQYAPGNIASPSRSKIYRAQVYNGIAGTKVLDIDTSVITSLNQASFTESSSNAATVTINRSGSAYRSAGITTAGYLYPGATNTFAASAIDYLNFGASDSFTVMAIYRYWNTMSLNRILIGKTDAGGSNPQYNTQVPGSSFTGKTDIRSTSSIGAQSQTFTAGALQSQIGVINRSTQVINHYQNGAVTTSASISGQGNLTNVLPVRIGTYSDGLYFTDMEFIGAAVFRTALTASQIRQISNYFANREVYL